MFWRYVVMKKTIIVILTLVMVFALSVPALANNGNGNGNGNGNNKAPAVEVMSFEFDVNNANFHCNDIEGSNGRVWPDLTNFGVVDGKGNGGGNNKNKMEIKFNVDRIESGSTKWKLTDTVVCPACGSTDWVTFSNNSGVPNGNNVQFQHSAPTRRYINITVVYNLDISECEIVCDYADCDFELDCDEDCDEDCDCGCADHTCAEHECSIVCECAASESQVIVTERKLIVIADGYYFYHLAPDVWKDGILVEGQLNPISEILYKSAKYNFYYVGAGDCECIFECDGVPCSCVIVPPPTTPIPGPNDPIESESHVAKWWYKHGIEILAYGANTTSSGQYFVAFDLNKYSSVTVSFGDAALGTMTFTADSDYELVADVFALLTNMISGNGWHNPEGFGPVVPGDLQNLAVFYFANPHGNGARQIYLDSYTLA